MPSPHGTAAPTPATTPRSAADKYWDTQVSNAVPAAAHDSTLSLTITAIDDSCGQSHST